MSATTFPSAVGGRSQVGTFAPFNQDVILSRTEFQPAVQWVKPLWWLAALLAALAMLGPFAIDTYLPAFDSIGKSLGATPFQMQQTLSGYLLGFSVMMLLHGALSDAIGRRPVILGGLTVFALASLICASANHVGVLIAGRVLQGMSCGAGMVVGRAIVRDLFVAVQAQRLMSQITLFFGIAPAIAPVIGGWLLVLIGWRSIFWFMMTAAIMLCVLAWVTLPETLPRESRQPFTLAPLGRGYRSVLSDPRFLLLTIASGVPFNAMFIFILSAPTLLGKHLGLPPTQFFWLFIFCISGIMGGGLDQRTSGRAPSAGTAGRDRLHHHARRSSVQCALAPVLPTHAGKCDRAGFSDRLWLVAAHTLHHTDGSRPFSEETRHGLLAPGLLCRALERDHCRYRCAGGDGQRRRAGGGFRHAGFRRFGELDALLSGEEDICVQQPMKLENVSLSEWL